VTTLLFPLVATVAIVDWAGDHPDRHAFLARCLARHLRGDWGDLDRHDWALNDRAVVCHIGRLLSSYLAPVELDPPDAHLWIITDDLADPHTVTTLLWPSHY
jgi:hypothetical protein